MGHSRGIPVLVNPSLRPGLDALDWWLADHHYSQHARERIVAFTAAEGTPTGSPDLEPEDEGEATEAFVSALPAVPLDGPAWDREDVVLDVALLVEGGHPWPLPEEPDGDDSDRGIPADAVLVPPELLELAPICGGAPEPYQPTDEDWADYRAWSEALERREATRAAEASRDPKWGYE